MKALSIEPGIDQHGKGVRNWRAADCKFDPTPVRARKMMATFLIDSLTLPNAVLTAIKFCGRQHKV
jgi:hypothetical protein